MKSLGALVWTAGLAAAISSQDGFVALESVLQARQINGQFYLPRTSSLQGRDYTSFTPPTSKSLWRRSDQPGPLLPAIIRSGSPNARARGQATGPAKISNTGMRGAQTLSVPSEEIGTQDNWHPHFAMANARSTSLLPYGKKISAEAKGQTVVGQVIPPPGARGKIRFHLGNSITDIPVKDRKGKFHTASSYFPGEAKVEAISKHGGQVQAFGINGMVPPNNENVGM